MPGGRGSLGLKPSLLCKVGGAKEESGALPCTPPSRPRLPAPAPPPAPPPPPPAPPPAAAPSSRSWCCGAAEQRIAVSMARDPSAKVRGRECGRQLRGLGRGGGGQARPSPCPFHPPGWARPFSPASLPVPHKGSGGARARPRAVLEADPPPRSRGPARGGDPRGDQCSLGSGSRLLASSRSEGELVLELQLETEIRSEEREDPRTVQGGGRRG